jgi:hypothetical protein
MRRRSVHRSLSFELLESRLPLHGGDDHGAGAGTEPFHDSSALLDEEDENVVVDFSTALAADLAHRTLFSANLGGQWGETVDWPVVAIHLALLDSGQVLFWNRLDTAWLWNPATGELSETGDNGFKAYCVGHAMLADGRLFVAGGHIVPLVGTRETRVYDADTNQWVEHPDMTARRWYPTVLPLPSGEVLVLSGSIQLNEPNRIPEVLQLDGTWRQLAGAEIVLGLYPRTFIAPNGLVFTAGPDAQSRYLDVASGGHWTDVAAMNYGNRYRGSAVMYEPGKILASGGSDSLSGVPTATAEVIDLNEPSPAWRPVGSMSVPRKNFDATLLPDGRVLVNGGVEGDGLNNYGSPVFSSEIWDPATEQFTLAASTDVPRWYHSTAVLMPDGRVLTAGGNGIPTAQFYSPPYLFQGPRPAVVVAPAAVDYGEQFFVATPDAAGIDDVTWIRRGSTSHAFGFDQRLNHLEFEPVPGGLLITAPASANLAPPGDYFLFLLRDGVPSVGQAIRVGSAPAISLENAASHTSTIVAASDIGSHAQVQLLDPATGEARLHLHPFATAFTGGVRVAAADVNDDSSPEIIAAAGPGGGPHVRVFDGATGEPLPGPQGSFFAYSAAFTGGVHVAAGDLDGDGLAEIVTGADAGGGPHVRVFGGHDGSVLNEFFAYHPAFTGGVRVAIGDVNGDGAAEIITAPGPGGGPHVRVFTLAGVPLAGGAASFFAYASGFTGGVYVAAADVDDDGRADIITGAGATGGPHVRIFSGLDGREVYGAYAYPADFTGGVRVAAADVNGDGLPEFVAAPGPGGDQEVRVFDIAGGTVVRAEATTYAIGEHGSRGGLFIAASSTAAIPTWSSWTLDDFGESIEPAAETAEPGDSRLAAALVDREASDLVNTLFSTGRLEFPLAVPRKPSLDAGGRLLPQNTPAVPAGRGIESDLLAAARARLGRAGFFFLLGLGGGATLAGGFHQIGEDFAQTDARTDDAGGETGQRENGA